MEHWDWNVTVWHSQIPQPPPPSGMQKKPLVCVRVCVCVCMCVWVCLKARELPRLFAPIRNLREQKRAPT
jgi:hypothetical protein